MNAHLKLRLSSRQRRQLETIASHRRTGNSGLKLSDVGREAIAEYIAREASASPRA